MKILLWLTWTVVAPAGFAREAQPPPQGVIITAVHENEAAADAGLKVGDLLLSWERAAKRGEFASQIDLFEIEAVEAPLGAVTLHGE